MKQFNNVLVEQFIHVDTVDRLRLRRFLVYALLLLLTVLAFFGMWFLASKFEILQGTPVTIALFVLVVGYLVSRRWTTAQFVEYEYSFIDGQMSVSKITNKERRKDQPGFDCDGVTLMTQHYDLNRGNVSRDFAKVYDYSSSPTAENRWYFIVDRSEGGRSLFVLEPNDRMFSAIREYIPKANYQP